MSSILMFILHAGFNPNSVSTPIGQRQLPPGITEDQQPNIVFSHKHNGLYLFLSRTMRPIWFARVVHCVKNDNRMQWVCFVTSQFKITKTNQILMT